MNPSAGQLLSAEWVILNAHDHPLNQASVRVVGNRITDIGPTDMLTAAFPDEPLHDFGTAAIAPGFVNSHAHTYNILVRGMELSPSNGNFGEFLATVWWPEVEDRLTPEMVMGANYHGCAQALLSGVTTLYDVIEAPTAIPGLLGPTLQAGTSTGIRMALSFEATERVSAENARIGLKENIDFLQELADHPMDRASGVMCWHTSYSCSGDFIREAVNAAVSFGVPSHFHCNEGSYEPQRAQADFGTSTIEHYDSLGIADSGLMASQCVVMTERELDLIAERNISVTHMPLSNGEFGAGIAPIPALLERGVTIGLGTDGFTDDFFEVIRGASLIHRANLQSSHIMPAATVFDLATRGGALALGLENLGTLNIGNLADIQIIDTDMATPATVDNLLDQIVLWRSAHDVTDVMVDGTWCVRDRRLLHVDLEQARDRVQASARKLWTGNEVTR